MSDELDKRITQLADYATRVIHGDQYKISTRLEIEQVIRQTLKEAADALERQRDGVIEECAVVAESYGEHYSRNAGNVYARHSGRAASKRIVEAIRSLKSPPPAKRD